MSVVPEKGKYLKEQVQAYKAKFNNIKSINQNKNQKFSFNESIKEMFKPVTEQQLKSTDAITETSNKGKVEMITAISTIPGYLQRGITTSTENLEEYLELHLKPSTQRDELFGIIMYKEESDIYGYEGDEHFKFVIQDALPHARHKIKFLFDQNKVIGSAEVTVPIQVTLTKDLIAMLTLDVVSDKQQTVDD